LRQGRVEDGQCGRFILLCSYLQRWGEEKKREQKSTQLVEKTGFHPGQL
jgi:hypothetical protein